MSRVTALRLGAVALYGAYWALSLFGFLGLDRSDAPHLPRELFYAVTIGVPCFLVGAAIGRWWAPAVGLLFVAFVPLGERCVELRTAGATTNSCSGVAASDLPLVLALTTPCVVAGMVAAKAWRRRRSGGGTPGVYPVATSG